jgi:hypothetical protein
MNQMLIPPYEPKQSQPVRTPTIYIKQSEKWEYKQVIRNLENENPPSEGELNALGADGWEMSGVAQQSSLAYFYFKRLVEK